MDSKKNVVMIETTTLKTLTGSEEILLAEADANGNRYYTTVENIRETPLNPAQMEYAALNYNNKTEPFLHIIIGDSKTEDKSKGTSKYRDYLIISRAVAHSGPGFGTFRSTPPANMWSDFGGTTTTNSEGILGFQRNVSNVQSYRLYSFGTYGNFNKFTFWTDNFAGGGTVTVKKDSDTVYTADTSIGLGRTKHEISLDNEIHNLYFTTDINIRLLDYIAEDTNGFTNVWNLGIGGYKVSNFNSLINSNWDDLTPYDPKLITIRLGVNDKYVVDSATFKTNMQTLIGLLQSKFPLANIMLCSVETTGDLTPPTSPIGEYTEKIKELCTENNCRLVDIRGLWWNWAKATTLGLTADTTHENTAGGNLVGQLYYKTLKI